ncbi:MAG: hypothetical protein AB7L09_02590 [Nitrospira sp.]
MSTIVYEFTDEDLALADQLAHLRNDRKEAMGIRSKKFDASKSEWDAHYQGILGELGAARALGSPIDKDELLAGDAGVDLRLKGGLSAEIRYRTQRLWDFALNGGNVSYLKSDVGILVWPGSKPNSVELVGWTSRVHILQHGEIMNFGYGDRLVLRHHKVVSMDRLMSIIERW